jgi:hypothetical protein
VAYLEFTDRVHGPIDAVGIRPQRAMQASGMGFGRGKTICEKHIIMQILPGSSDDARLINVLEEFCNSSNIFPDV